MEGMTKRRRFIRFASGPAGREPNRWKPSRRAWRSRREAPASVLDHASCHTGDDPVHEMGAQRACGNCGNLILLPDWWTPIGVGDAKKVRSRWSDLPECRKCRKSL